MTREPKCKEASYMHSSDLGCCFSQKKDFLFKVLNNYSFCKRIKYHHACSTYHTRNLGTVMNAETPNQTELGNHPYFFFKLSTSSGSVSQQHTITLYHQTYFVTTQPIHWNSRTLQLEKNRTTRFNCGVIISKRLTKTLLLPSVPF